MKMRQVSSAIPPCTVLKTARCPSLSGRSELTYQLGRGEDGQLYVRVTANSAPGRFSDAWTSVARIFDLFDLHCPGNAPVTSGTIAGLFEGRSENTPGFALAALKAEGLVAASESSKRGYDRLGGASLAGRLTELMVDAGPSGAGAKAKAKKTKKATSTKGRSRSSEKRG